LLGVEYLFEILFHLFLVWRISYSPLFLKNQFVIFKQRKRVYNSFSKAQTKKKELRKLNNTLERIPKQKSRIWPMLSFKMVCLKTNHCGTKDTSMKTQKENM
jgi:hypothetical protein